MKVLVSLGFRPAAGLRTEAGHFWVEKDSKGPSRHISMAGNFAAFRTHYDVVSIGGERVASRSSIGHIGRPGKATV